MPDASHPFVLVVDDNEATCTLITALLRREFSCEVTMDGQEAMEKLRTKNYAAILLDLRMPQIDGFAVLDYLKANQPEMLQRVLVVTAALTRHEMVRVKEYEICALIPKPFEVETLLAAVKECTRPDRGKSRNGIVSSGVILLLADLLRQRFL